MHKLIKKKIFKRVMAGTLAFTLFAGSIGSPRTVSASDGVSAASSESIVSYDTDLVYPEGDCAGAGEDGAAEEGGSDTVVSADSQTGVATEATETEAVHTEAGSAAADGTAAESSEATNGTATESSGTMNGMNAGTSGTTDAAGTEQTGQEVTLAGLSETGTAAETELGISMTSEAGGDVSEAEAENTLLTTGESETETETEDADPDGGDCYVGGLSVTSIVDGTAPFDSDDEAGDDSNDDNRIVRSFDYVSYTLSYTTALADEKVSVDSGTLYVEFVLPCSPNIAIFNMDAMNWMVDPRLTYYFADGTTGTSYDDAEDVVKQVLTGYRELTNAASMAIPGAGTLSVGLYVGAAPNGTVIQPSFTLWMKGNKETQKVSVTPDAVTVSAAAKYKVQIKQAVDMNVYGEYDLSTGNENAAQDMVSNVSKVRGRMEGYGITVLMENDSVEKGLKGLEFQSGEITFDITLNEYSMNASGALLSDQTGYTPVLWDYDENVRSSSYGEWGRQFVRFMGFAYNAAPFNVLGCSYSSIYDACYDGGDWSITQDADDPLTYHVTIRDYSVDTENYIFPTLDCSWTTQTSGGSTYKANQACLSAGSIQAVMQFPYGEIGEITNVYFKVTADNFAVNGTAYDTTSSFSNTYTLLPAGSLNTCTNFTDIQAAIFSDVDNQLGTTRSSGDAASYRTASVRLWQVIATTTDEAVETKIGLLKWDADAFEVDRTSQYYSAHGRIARGTFTAYFVGRTLNWSSVQEMSDTLMNDSSLHFFSDLDALEAAGYVCVGMLWINDISVSGPGQQEYYGIDLLVKDTAAIGETYAAVSEGWGAYSDVDPMTAGSGSEVLLDIDMIEKYDLYSAYCSIDAYAAMGKTGTTDAYYVKTEYDEDGNIISGTHRSGPYAGTSLLICGEKATVDISIADTGSNGEEKAVYDMDAGERTVTYSVQPYLEVQGNSSTGSGATSGKSTAVVKVTLPEDLTYDEGSSYWGGEAVAPEIETNDDGTVTLIYTLADVTVGETLDTITFSCTIGHAGTMDDVVNNQSLSVSATIASTRDNRRKTAGFGNYSSVGLVIVKLMAISISKQADPRLIEQDGSFSWTFLFANESDEAQKSTRLADVLPSDGDSMGSDFSGTYQVDSISIDFFSAKTSFESDVDSMAFYVTTGTVGESASSLVSQGSSAVSSWKDLMGQASVDRENYTVTINTSGYEDMTAFYFDLGTLASKESLSFTLSVTTDGNEPGDIYCNKFYEYGANQSASVTSVLVSTQVVERNVSGVAWLDADNDGIRSDSETLLSGVTAKLYRTNASGNDPSKKSVLTVNGVKLYTAYDVLGDEVSGVTTGKDGSYRFTSLEAGTYYVVFSGMDGYGLTVQDAGEDDTVDSDATASVNSDSSGIEYAYISDLVLPVLEEMFNYLYESAHNDAGFISLTSGLTIRKVAEGTSVGLVGAIFVLKDSDGNYLTFADGSYSGTREKVNADCYLTTGTDGTVTINGLTYGTYTLSEYQAPDGYQLSKETWKIKVQGKTTESGWESYVTVDGDLLDGELVIENASETTTVTVTKAWKDNSNQDGLRTDVSLTLTGTVTTVTGGTETVVTKTGTIRANATKQEYTFTKLPVYSSGLKVTYTVTEEAVVGYEISYSALDGDWESGYSMVVTNTHTTETTEYSVVKVWDDDGNRDGVRPETIEVKLIGSDGSERVAKLAEDAGWKYTFTDLPMYWKEGTAIKYTLEESPVSDYVREVSDADSSNQFTVTNTHEIATVDIPVEKIWDDSDDQDGVRADSITVILTGSDGSVREAVLTEESDWKYTYNDLPVYFCEGVAISYSLQEKAVDGYSDEVQVGEDGCSYIVTNNHIPAVTDLVIVKNWDDADNQDGIRPGSIHVVLNGTDGNTYEADLTKENGYSYLFSGLPVYYDHGTIVEYSVSEEAVDGYQTEITVDDSGYIFTVTNTHEPETISVPVTKTWEDNDDQDGLRPDEVEVILTGSDGSRYSAVLTEESGWSYTFENLPVYWNCGDTIAYSLQETAVDGYESVVLTGEDPYAFILTNTHIPETESESETEAETETETETETESETPAGTSGSTDTPQTGDNSPLLFWMGIAWTGLLGMGGSLLLMRRRRRRAE